MSMQMAKRVSLSRSWGLNRSPHKIEQLYPFTGHNMGVTGCSGRIDRTLALSVRSCDTRHVSPLFEYCLPDLNDQQSTGRYGISDQTLSLQRPVISSMVPETSFFDRTCPVMLDWTHPAFGHLAFPLCKTMSV